MCKLRARRSLSPIDQPRRDGALAALSGEAAPERIRIPFIRRARLAAAGAREETFVIDIGMRGAFVERTESLAVGTEVVLAFRIPGNERDVVVHGRVAWWHPRDAAVASKGLPAGLGIEFTAFEGDGGERVRRHVLEYLGRSPRLRRFNRRPEAGGNGG